MARKPGEENKSSKVVGGIQYKEQQKKQNKTPRPKLYKSITTWLRSLFLARYMALSALSNKLVSILSLLIIAPPILIAT